MMYSVPFVSQHDASIPKEWRERACGIAALKMALEYYCFSNKVIITVPGVRELVAEGEARGAYLDGVGWRHDGLIELATAHGARGYREEYKEDKGVGIAVLKEKLDKGHIPIVSVARDHSDASTFHLVVLTGYDEQGFYYNDSSFWEEEKGKNKFVTFKDFEMLWRGLALFIHT